MKSNDNKKMGRPVLDFKKDTRIGIRLDENTLKKLNEYCQKKSQSKSEVIRLAINNYIK